MHIMSVDTREQLSNAYRWYVVILLLSVSILAYVDRIVFALLIDPIKTDLHISDTQAGVLVGLAFGLSYAVAGLALGRIVDRHKRNIVLGAALAVWSCFTMLSGFTVGVTLLFLARCGVGIGESAVNPASIAIIGSSFPRDRVSYGLSTFTVGIYGGGGLAIILGGQLSAYLTSFGPISIFGSPIAVWRLVFICVGVPGLLLAPLVILTIRDRRDKPNPSRSAVEIRRSGPSVRDVFAYACNQGALYPLLFGGLIAFGFYIYAIQGWIPAMLSRTYGLTSHQISIFYGVPYLTGGVSGALLAGPIIHYLEARGRTDSPVLICQWASLLALAPAILGPLAHNATVAIACTTAVILLAAIQQSAAFSSYVLVTPEGMRGQVTATYVLLMNVIAGTLGGIVVGILSDHVFGAGRLGSGISVVALIGLPTAALLFSLLRPVYRRAVAKQLASAGTSVENAPGAVAAAPILSRR
jgi:MFS family permease